MFKRVKYPSLLLVIMLLFATATLTYGAPPQGAAAQDKVTIGFVYGSFAPQEKWEHYFEGFLAQHPEVTINYIPVPLDSWAEYTQKIVTLLAGGEQVDVIWDAIEAVPLMADKGILRSLDSYMKDDAGIQEYIQDVNPKLLARLRWKDQQYLLPFAWNTQLIYYNKAVLQSVGLPDPSPDWTWDDFLAYAQKITQDTDGDGTPDVWGFQVGSSMWSLGPWTISNGSFWMNEDFSQPWYNKPETIEAVQFAHDLIWKYKVAPSGDFSTDNAFAAGTLGMFAGAPADREALIPAGMTPADYDVTYWPTHTKSDAAHGSIWGTDGYGITQSSAHPDLAWEMIKDLVSTDVMSNLLSGDYASASAPSRNSLANDPRLVAASPAHYQYFFDVLAGSRTVVNSPIFAELGEIHDRYMTRAWANEISVDDAMAGIQTDMEALIAGNS